MPTTLADLLDAFELFAVCTSCHKTEQLNLQVLCDQRGRGYSIEAVRQRVRCTDCGRRTQDIRIVYIGQCGGASGFHYRV